MKKIMLVFGTRPEAIKMCPLVKELQIFWKMEYMIGGCQIKTNLKGR